MAQPTTNSADLNQHPHQNQQHQQHQQWMQQPHQYQQQWMAMQYPATAMAMMQQQMMMYPQHYMPYLHHHYQPPHHQLKHQQTPPTPPPQQQHQHQKLGSSGDEIRTIWLGDLHHWMDENYLHNCFAHTGEVVSAKVIRNKQTGQSEGYGFVEFYSRATAEKVLQNYSVAMMPNTDQPFRLNWATFSAGDRRSDASSDLSIFVGDLAIDVTDAMLQETFASRYSSIKGAKLKDDPLSKVACETCTKTGMVMVFGEITTKSKVNYEQVVRDTLKKIGYDAKEKGIDYRTCNVVVALEEQSPDIAQSVVGAHQERAVEDIGAGDQGHMFGYASDETPELMPLTHSLATQLGARLTKVRVDGTLKWVRPDGKTQVVVEYKRQGSNGGVSVGPMEPVRVHTLVISTQHDDGISNEQISKDLMEHVIKPVVPAKYLDDNTIYHLNPSGRFVIGGPHGDAGLTGRKIIIDSYGGWGAHGGGAFSGKDPTKVDRSAAYAARWIAKSLVAAKLARRVLVQVSYAIGVAHPLSIFVDSYGTGSKSDSELLDIVKANFDLRPGCIIRDLKLTRPIYQKTAAYSHFGRDDADFTWETPKALKY